MKISTRGRYALRLMIDIAQQNTEEPIPLKEQYDIYEAFGARLKEYGMILEAEMLKAKEEF